ncbi:hypothetical protein [Loktanella sp. 5RATIMAR09]|uniref:hypothetical protein n=1 Tax=Loktanella sp. 5RATIMAR09 TaxID=1225655 RepID=UPI0012EDCD28|nr:hypothetical protein [Loktanella sp. 5RATIMAR09]
MIGIFQTTLEEERMRDAYQKFKATKAADPDNEPLKADGIEFKAKYSLEGFTPSFRGTDMAPESAPDIASSLFYAAAASPIAKLSAMVSVAPQTEPFFAQSWIAGRPELTLEPAASVVVITEQSSYLSDNDMLLLGDGDTVFADPSTYLAQQLQLEVIANAIAQPVSAEMIIPGENATQDAIALHLHISQAESSTITGVSAKMMHGTDAYGMHINGEVAEDIPSVAQMWPAFKLDGTNEAADAGATTDDDSTDQPEDGEQDFPNAFEGLGEGDADSTLFEPIDGHSVVMGANTLVNEVVISSAWLDAPVFSVMGDVVDISVISQINVLVDRDTGNFDEQMASSAMNAAAQTVTATTPIPEDGEAETNATDEASSGLPAHWVVTRVDSDLIQMNQVSQYNFVTDHDCAEIVFGSASTYIGMGDNTLVNLTDLAELGYGYDLVMIGGSMISVNWISQINVVIDNDVMTFSGVTSAGFSGSDNLLFNAATINTTGVDSYSKMQDNFAAASEDLANGGGISTKVSPMTAFLKASKSCGFSILRAT